MFWKLNSEPVFVTTVCNNAKIMKPRKEKDVLLAKWYIIAMLHVKRRLGSTITGKSAFV